jgi:hypothetical protein
MKWSNSALVRLAGLARQRHCAWAKIRYTKPTQVQHLFCGGPRFRFLDASMAASWCRSFIRRVSAKEKQV